MDQSSHDRHAEALRDSVRRNAGSAGIAAALLIYFGFFAGLISPTGTSLFDWGNWLFFHTLRIGGIAMAVITVGSMLGQPIALVVDAMVSILIGALFVLSGAIMLIDGGRGQAFLNIIFGVMFASAGVRNGRVLAGYITTRTTTSGDEPGVFEDARRSDVPEARPVSSSLAGQLRERTARVASMNDEAQPAESIWAAPAEPTDVWPSEEPTEPNPAAEADELGAIDDDIEPTPPADSPPEPEPPAPDAPGGFLASFADDDSPGRI